MKPVVLTVSLLGLLGIFAACSSEATVAPATNDPNTPAGDGPGEEQTKDPNDPVNQPPHSLGTITLGESHVAGTGTSYPIVSATFVPDAAKVRSCKQKLDANCEFVEAPKCTTQSAPAPGTGTGCGQGEACVFDEGCAPTCKKLAVCSMQCEADEVCTLDQAGKAACTKAETFDAGPIAFSGTTTTITLFPPYQYKSDGKGAPFLAGADIKVQAQGATGAGFEKFEETFKATTFLQTTPVLNKIARETVFGAGALPVVWAPGEDTIVVTVAGAGGSVTCKAKDADGKFDLPRAAIDAAIGEQKANVPPALSLSVARQRSETKKDKKAKGPLASMEVQPEGWVELVTLSTESTTFQGCVKGVSICGTSCVDLQKDSKNCGECGKTCGTGTICAAGKCQDPTVACNACVDATKTATCKATWDACTADAECSALETCYGGCTDQACIQTCRTQHPTGQAKAQAFGNCALNACTSTCR